MTFIQRRAKQRERETGLAMRAYLERRERPPDELRAENRRWWLLVHRATEEPE